MLENSTAMACSDIPFEYYISEVRVARINGEANYASQNSGQLAQSEF